MTLSELSPALEAAMGWLGGHLHAFEADGVFYEMPDPYEDDFREAVDERGVRLSEVLSSVGSKMRWDYDFGDGWKHDVVVESIEARERGAVLPACLDGKRACPPEDCGGPFGYEELLAALGDPKQEDHDRMVGWAPTGFDPDAFDSEEASEWMRSPRPLRGW